MRALLVSATAFFAIALISPAFAQTAVEADGNSGVMAAIPFGRDLEFAEVSLTQRISETGRSVAGFVCDMEGRRRNWAPHSSPIEVAVADYSAPRVYDIRLSADV